LPSRCHIMAYCYFFLFLDFSGFLGQPRPAYYRD
jgi:hypothetical protein